MHTVEIRPEAIEELAKAFPAGQPITMLNLLRFREHAQYEVGATDVPCSGRAAYYERYAAVSTRVVGQQQGKVIWAGRVVGHSVCPPDERWDDLLIVEYPDAAALAAVFNDPAYRAVVYHRTAALIDSRLLPMTEGGVGV